MRCPRCQQDNLPGLPACMACGQDLAAPLVRPASTVPQVEVANPLAPARRPSAPPRRAPGLAPPGLRVLGGMLHAAAWGLVPGLGALQRRDRRLAAVLVGALLACALGLGLTWTSVIQPSFWMLGLSVLASSIYLEIRARTVQDGPSYAGAAVLLSASLALCLHALAAFSFDTWLPRVSLPTTQSLPAGQFMVERVQLQDLAPDQLVAVGEQPRFWQLLTPPVEVAPVLALAGQEVRVEEGRVLVDGLPSTVAALNPRSRAPALPGAPSASRRARPRTS